MTEPIEPGAGAADIDALVRDRAAVRVDLPEPMLEAMLQQARALTVERRPTLRDRLRELPSSARVVLVLTTVLGTSSVLAGASPRDDLAALWRLDLVVWGSVLLLVTVGSVLAVLRGMHRRPLGPIEVVLAALGLGLPVLLSLLPGLLPGVALPDGEAMAMHRACFAGSGLIAGPTAALALSLVRDDKPPLARVFAAAGAGGAAAFLAQALHCPWSDMAHLLVSHASVGVAVAAVAVAVTRMMSGGDPAR